MNFLRAFLQGGYASLDNVNRWALDFMKDKPIERSYETLAAEISRTLEIMRALGINEQNTRELATTDFYTSHEALLLGYEQAMTRRDEVMGTGRYYATSAHMIWIGDRTRQPDHAHVEFCRGVENPIGLKCGPTLEPDGLLKLIDILNPKNEAGPADADLPVRLRQGREAPAETDPRRREGRPDGCLVLRSDARQHGHRHRRCTRRGRSSASRRRSSTSSTFTGPRAPTRAASISR